MNGCDYKSACRKLLIDEATDQTLSIAIKIRRRFIQKPQRRGE
jgi:hypothetical protein